MTRPRISAWLRRAEIAFFSLGLAALGWAAFATIGRIAFQADQVRAFSEMEIQAAAAPAAREADLRVPVRDPLLLGRIEIPRLDLVAIIREGTDDATLAVAVGHVRGTARPGEPGTVVVAGHRDTFFRALRDIRLHDTIRISTPGAEAVYSVDSTEVVGSREVRVLEPTEAARLTLVTCYPFGFVGNAPRRFVVRASMTGERTSPGRADRRIGR